MSLLKDKNLQIILVIVSLGVMGGSLVAPILPSVMVALSIPRENIGLMLSVLTLTAAIFTPIFGVLADRIGRKKIIIASTLLFGIAGFLISFNSSFEMILALRALQGIGLAGMMGLAITVIGDLYDGNKRETAMGYRTTTLNITTSIAPFIGGSLAVLSWRYPFLIYFLAIPVSLIAFKLDLPKVRPDHNLKEYFSSIFRILKNLRTFLVILSNFMIFFFLYLLVVYIPILIYDNLSLSTLYAGLSITIFSIVSAIVSLMAGELMNKYEKYNLVIFSFLMIAVALILIPLANSFSILALILIIFGVGFGINLPVLSTLATELAPMYLRAGVVSGVTMMMYIGQSASPPFFGLLLKYSNLDLIFLVGAIIAFVYISVLLFFKEHLR